MPNFASIAEDMKLEDIQNVPSFPPGHFLGLVVGPYERIEGTNGISSRDRITFRLTQPGEDVEQADLTTYLEATHQELRDVQMQYLIWEGPYYDENWRDLCLKLGMSGITLKQAKSEIPGKEAQLHIIPRPGTDRNGTARLYPEIRGILKAE